MASGSPGAVSWLTQCEAMPGRGGVCGLLLTEKNAYKVIT
jgi:hypothetical protein